MSVDRAEEVEGGESETVTTAAAETAAVHYYSVAPGYRINVRRGPGTQYGIVRVLPEGAQVAIYCQTPGTSVAGPYGTSNIWDNIANGEFVSDAYVLTGSDGYVASRCG
ncbi:SH3 domain-containing protein [Streptomyces cellulosae]|uniref:SH3 domain-containing protein n=1 Tax=Streptomyces cellulosae TaxID=1968 RepID=UPI0004C5EDC4|nr:SH3 domain-containing protein [Streptomyces cellulosae]